MKSSGIQELEMQRDRGVRGAEDSKKYTQINSVGVAVYRQVMKRRHPLRVKR